MASTWQERCGGLRRRLLSFKPGNLVLVATCASPPSCCSLCSSSAFDVTILARVVPQVPSLLLRAAPS